VYDNIECRLVSPDRKPYNTHIPISYSYFIPSHILLFIYTRRLCHHSCIIANRFSVTDWAWWATSEHWPQQLPVGVRSCCTLAWVSRAPRPARWTNTGTPHGHSPCRPPSVLPVSKAALEIYGKPNNNPYSLTSPPPCHGTELLARCLTPCIYNMYIVYIDWNVYVHWYEALDDP